MDERCLDQHGSCRLMSACMNSALMDTLCLSAAQAAPLGQSMHRSAMRWTRNAGRECTAGDGP